MEKRTFQLELGSTRSSERTIEASLSSEYPVERHDGVEILEHTPEAVDLSRSPLPLIASHDTGALPVGVVEGLRVAGQRLRGILRLSDNQDGIWKDIKDGILRNVSVGYLVQKRIRTKTGYRVTRWQPYECSLVAAPADPTVGIGRSLKERENQMADETKNEKQNLDDEKNVKPKDQRQVKDPGNDQKRHEPEIFSEGRRDVANGEIRLLTNRENLRDLETPPLPDGIRPDELSMGRALRGIVTGDWTGAEAEQRVMSGGTASAGGYLIPTPLSSRVIDLARNKSVAIQAGALTVPMDSLTLKLGKITTDPTGYWRAENAAITESDMAFDQVTLTAKALACLVRTSIELVEDAANMNTIIENAIGAALATELDRVALFGSGSGAEPAGLFGTTGINEVSMGTNGAALADYDEFSQAYQEVLTDNGNPTVVIYAPRTFGALDRMRTADNVAFAMPESFKKLTRLVSNQVPIDQTQGTATNASCALMGGFENLLIGMRKILTIEVSRTADSDTFSKMQVLIRAYLRADIAVTRADQFCQIVGIIPA